MAAAPVKAARPRDRKGDIAAAAARLFREQGYHQVGIDDVAAAVGITGGAIYRHFGNKQALLARTIDDALSAIDIDGVVDDAGLDLDGVLTLLAERSLERRERGLLLQREIRHLPDDERAGAEARLEALGAVVGSRLRAERPTLAPHHAAALVRAALAVFASPSYHAASLARPRAEALLAAMAGSVLRSDAPPPEPNDAASNGNGAADVIRPRASRREMLVAAAIQLFGRRGYAAVKMEDVGAAVGITGPSIYQHFAGKSDLLVAALTRGADWLQLGLNRALAGTTTPTDGLGRLVDSYVDYVLGHTDEMRLLLGETVGLPPADRETIRRMQNEYVAEWVALLVEVRPELVDAEARFLVHGAFGVVNDTVGAGGVAAGGRAMVVGLVGDLLATPLPEVAR